MARLRAGPDRRNVSGPRVPVPRSPPPPPPFPARHLPLDSRRLRKAGTESGGGLPQPCPRSAGEGAPRHDPVLFLTLSCVGSSVHGRCNLKSTRRRPVTLSAIASPAGRPLPCEPARPQVAANNEPFPCRSAHDEPVSFAVQLKCPLCCEGFSVSVVGTHFQFHLFTYLFICLFINLPPPPRSYDKHLP